VEKLKLHLSIGSALCFLKLHGHSLKELNQNYISQETKSIFTMDLCSGFHVGKNLGVALEKLHIQPNLGAVSVKLRIQANVGEVPPEKLQQAEEEQPAEELQPVKCRCRRHRLSLCQRRGPSPSHHCGPSRCRRHDP